MDERTVQTDVARIDSAWQREMGRLSAVSADVERLSGEIDAAKREISDLIAAKRGVAREERQALNGEISDAVACKSALISEIREKRSELAEIRGAMRAIRSDAGGLQRWLRTEQGRLSKGVDDIRRSPAVSVKFGISEVRGAVEEGQSFCVGMLGALDAVFERHSRSSGNLAFPASDPLERLADVLGGAIDDIVAAPLRSVIGMATRPFGGAIGAVAGAFRVATDWTAETVKDSVGGLILTEPPIKEIYLTVDEAHKVPFESYSVFDTLDIPRNSVIELGDAAVEYAGALLRSLGHAGVTAIGGPGLPDLLSVDSDKRLWVSEVKGTQTFRELSASGLRRTLSARGKDGERVEERLMENSPAWLARSSGTVSRPVQVLAAIDDLMGKENVASRREELRVLRESYREAARSGFNPLVCERQLVQVGFHADGDVLKPPHAANSQAFDDWVRIVEPSKIIQIDVKVGDTAERATADADENTISFDGNS